MASVEFVRYSRNEGENDKEGYFLPDLRLSSGKDSAHRTVLFDTGADWITVSEAVAYQLGIDLKEEFNPGLTKKWNRSGRDDAMGFLYYNDWLESEKKAVKLKSTLANGEDVDTFLYPVEVEFPNGADILVPVNFMPETGIPLFGRKPFFELSKKIIFEDDSIEMVLNMEKIQDYNDWLSD